MNSTVNKKLLGLITVISDGYSLIGDHVSLLKFSYETLAKEIDVSVDALEALLENLKSKRIIESFSADYGYFIDDVLCYEIEFPENFTSRINDFIEKITEIPPVTKKNNYNLKLDEAKGSFYLSCNGEKTFLTKQADTRLVKFMRVLAGENLGKFKSVDAVIEAITLDEDKNFETQTDKITVIKNTLKEIQSKLSNKKLKIKPSLLWTPNKNSVSLILKGG